MQKGYSIEGDGDWVNECGVFQMWAAAIVGINVAISLDWTGSSNIA